MKTITPIVKSLMEMDLYKLTMWQAMLHKNPGTHAKYRFQCRNSTAYPLSDLVNDINSEIDHLCTLRFENEELEFLKTKSYFKSDFIEWLRLFQFQKRFITIKKNNDSLEITTEGPQIHIMGFEIYVLSIVNELYFRRLQTPNTLNEARSRLKTKIEALKAFKKLPSKVNPYEFFDFGLRRRFSSAWHEEVVQTLIREVPEFFKGTSNIYLAKKYDLTPIGTMAHEYLQSYQGQDISLRNFQKQALEDWVQEYRGELGIALTDCVGMDAFLKDFDLYFAKLFDGLRHDSGDPFVWAQKALDHYESLRINANTKRLVFSDGLDFQKTFDLYSKFADKVKTGFGIGTNLTNDCGIKPINIVMKLIECNGKPTAKLPDSPGKVMCTDMSFVVYLSSIFNQPYN